MKLVVVKIGSSTAENCSEELSKFVYSYVELGLKVLVTHGWGKTTSRMMSRDGYESSFIESPSGVKSRKCDQKTIDYIISASNILSKKITSSLENFNIQSKHLCGFEDNVLSGTPRRTRVKEGRAYKLVSDNFIADLGRIDLTRLTNDFIENDVIVLAPLLNVNNQCHNTDVDSCSAKLASSLNANGLFYITDVPGVKIGDAIATKITREELKSGSVKGGMRKKVAAALKASSLGVDQVKIIGLVNPDGGTIVQY